MVAPHQYMRVKRCAPTRLASRAEFDSRAVRACEVELVRRRTGFTSFSDPCMPANTERMKIMSEKRFTRQRAPGTTYPGARGRVATTAALNAEDEVHCADVLAALRENQRLLRELAYTYRMPRQLARSPTSTTGVPAVSCPHDVVKLLGEEMSTLCQEQLRVLLLVILRGIHAV